MIGNNSLSGALQIQEEQDQIFYKLVSDCLLEVILRGHRIVFVLHVHQRILANIYSLNDFPSGVSSQFTHAQSLFVHLSQPKEASFTLRPNNKLEVKLIVDAKDQHFLIDLHETPKTYELQKAEITAINEYWQILQSSKQRLKLEIKKTTQKLGQLEKEIHPVADQTKYRH